MKSARQFTGLIITSNLLLSGCGASDSESHTVDAPQLPPFSGGPVTTAPTSEPINNTATANPLASIEQSGIHAEYSIGDFNMNEHIPMEDSPLIAPSTAQPPSPSYPEFNHQQMMLLAKQQGCLDCHALNHEIMGPSFQAIAQHYKTLPNAQQQLITSVTLGSVDKWGMVMMPANSATSEQDVEQLTLFILSLVQP